MARAFSPLDERLGLSGHTWTPGTMERALRLGVDVPSLRRAAEHFEALTGVMMSKSSLHALVGEYGARLAQGEAEEAEALSAGRVETPAPQPEAETMAVSMDGVMVHLRDEGWKEVKTAAISAVVVEEDEEGTPRVGLESHSYRAGLWDAPTFAKQQWAEGWRRGLERARRVVAVSDGAAWIWNIVRTCYAPCVEIIDWWHALQRVWAIAFVVYGQGTAEAERWAQTLKELLWRGEVRALCREVRRHWPRGRALPDDLRLAIGYLSHHRARLRYRVFREAGCPIGSGTVESACKVVVQERACQAGMRWSRPRLQALLALRCALLSNRWEEAWATLAPAKVT